MRKLLTALLVLALSCSCQVKQDYDVIIAGGGTGGFAAAVQAARQGCDVLLLEETDWLGGQMSAAGVGTMDEGTPRIREYGIYKEFCDRAADYYAGLGLVNNVCYFKTECISVEPFVGQKIIYDMIDDVNDNYEGHIDVKLISKVVSVKKDGNKVVGATVESGLEDKVRTDYTCHILVDATEYGDVIPLTGARYLVAKHFSDSIDVNSNVQHFTWTAIVKEYDEGVPEELRLNVKPRNYGKYLWKYRWINNYADDLHNVYANPTSWNSIAQYRGMPDSHRPGVQDHTVKTELNVAQNDVHVTVKDCVDPDARLQKDIEMRLKTLGLLYYMQNELGLNWSVDPAEGYDTPYNHYITDKMIEADSTLAPFRNILIHFPVMPYVRESNRIIGQHILISTEISRVSGPEAFEDALALCDYPEDLHGSSKKEDMDLLVDPTGKYGTTMANWDERCGEFQVPFRSFIPEEVDGFLVAEKNISQSRLVNGATRLQPSTMNVGQATGNIAALAVKYGVQPREIPPIHVQFEQVKAKSPLWIKPVSDVTVESEGWNYAQIALANGWFELKDRRRFYPHHRVSEDEFSALVQKYGLTDVQMPLTRLEMSRLLVDHLMNSTDFSMRGCM